MSHSLTFLFKKSDVRDLSKLLAKNELFAQKFVFLYTIFLTVFFLSLPKSESLPLLFAHSLFFKERLERFTHSLFFKEQLEGFAPVALYKRTTLPIRSGRS